MDCTSTLKTPTRLELPDDFLMVSRIICHCRGKKLFDPKARRHWQKLSTCLRDYLTSTDMIASSDEIDEASFMAAANICDENVSLAAGGTEKRYESHGVVDTANPPKQVIEEMLSAMAGTLTYSGGKFYVKAGAYSSPSDTLTEDDLRAGISIVANQVAGTTLTLLKVCSCRMKLATFSQQIMHQ